MKTGIDLFNEITAVEPPSGLLDRIHHSIANEKMNAFSGAKSKLVLAGFSIIVLINLSVLLPASHREKDEVVLVQSMHLSNDNNLYK